MKYQNVFLVLIVLVFVVLFSIHHLGYLREGNTGGHGGGGHSGGHASGHAGGHADAHHGTCHIRHGMYYGGSTGGSPWYPYWYTPAEEQQYYLLQYPIDYVVAQ